MASLKEVVLELQEQNRMLDDTNSELRHLNKTLTDQVSQQKSQRGDDLEEKRKAERSKRTQSATPTTFKGGLVQGSGIGDLKDMLPTFSLLAGVGETLPALLGAAVGKTFAGAAGVLLGKSVLTPWLERKLGDWNVPLFDAFGQEVDVADIGGMLGGAVALMFGPRLLKTSVSNYFARNAAEAGLGGAVRGAFFRKLGMGTILASAGLVAGGMLNEYITANGGSEAFGNVADWTVQGASIGATFGPYGAVVGALAGLAIGGISELDKYFREKNDEIVKEVQGKVDEATIKLNEAIANNDSAAAMEALVAQYDNVVELLNVDPFDSETQKTFEQLQTDLEAAKIGASEAVVTMIQDMQATMSESAALMTQDLGARTSTATTPFATPAVVASRESEMAQLVKETLANDNRLKEIIEMGDLAGLSQDQVNRQLTSALVGRYATGPGALISPSELDMFTNVINQTLSGGAKSVINSQGYLDYYNSRIAGEQLLADQGFKVRQSQLDQISAGLGLPSAGETAGQMYSRLRASGTSGIDQETLDILSGRMTQGQAPAVIGSIGDTKIINNNSSQGFVIDPTIPAADPFAGGASFSIIGR